MQTFAAEQIYFFCRKNPTAKVSFSATTLLFLGSAAVSTKTPEKSPGIFFSQICALLKILRSARKKMSTKHVEPARAVSVVARHVRTAAAAEEKNRRVAEFSDAPPRQPVFYYDWTPIAGGNECAVIATRAEENKTEEEGQILRPLAGIVKEQWMPQAGDIVLFSVDECSAASRFISTATRSEWTHATLIDAGSPLAIPFGGLAAASPEADAGTDGLHWRTLPGDRILLFESVSRLDAAMWDFVTGQKRCGIRLVDAFQRLREVCSKFGRRAVVRRIHPMPEGLVAAMRDIRREFAGGTYARNPLTMMETLLCSPQKRGTGEAAELVAPGKNAQKEEDVDSKALVGCLKSDADVKRAFCSQLVAEVMIRAGLLPKDRPSTAYSPGDFADGGLVERELAKVGKQMSRSATIMLGTAYR